jgi:hypothetical protein
LLAKHDLPNIDMSIWMEEYLRGLWPPARAIARCAVSKVQTGDLAAGARLIAKLGQLQAYFVWGQMFLGVVAASALLLGLKAS